MIWTQANREIVLTLVTWPISIASAQLLIRFDERWLTPVLSRIHMWWLPPARLEDAWLPSTRDLMTVMLGPLCLPIHSIRCRFSVRGLLRDPLMALVGLFWGIVWGVLGVLLGYLPVELVGQAVEQFLK
jgi:hypothetical protein